MADPEDDRTGAAGTGRGTEVREGMSSGMTTIIALLGIAYIGMASNIAAQRTESRAWKAILLSASTVMIALIAVFTVRMLLGAN